MQEVQNALEDILSQVLRLVTPGKDEALKVTELSEKVRNRVERFTDEVGLKADVMVYGSVAKGTWISGEVDVDIFLRVSPSLPRKEMAEKSLTIGKRAVEVLGGSWVERYAEHPYVEGWVEGVRINIVPCYAVAKGRWLSAVDRSPFHTEYVRLKLDADKRMEVRLLKKLMRGINVYGADIKIGGFSGYLCELLIIHYGGFIKTLEAVNLWKRGEVIDIENHFKGKVGEAIRLFPEPLIVVDPVDEMRNVASAVSFSKLCEFIAAAKYFLEKPSIEFFSPSEPTIPKPKELSDVLKIRGSAMLFIGFGRVEAVPDILWGQMYRSLRAISRLLHQHGFNILRTTAWSDERSLNVLILEIDRKVLPNVKLHFGPPVWALESKGFLEKYVGNSIVVAGPWIRDERWVVEVLRKHVDAADILREALKDGGLSVGIRGRVAQTLREGFRVLINEEVEELCIGNKAFTSFLTQYLKGIPVWLR